MLVNSQTIDWDKSSGQLLQDSLVLTDSEKSFAFYRALFELKTYRNIVNTMIASFGVIGAYGLGSFVNTKLRMFRRPFYVSFKLIVNQNFCKFKRSYFSVQLTGQVCDVSGGRFGQLWDIWSHR